MTKRLVFIHFVLAAFILVGSALGASGAFDLSGPRLEVKVTRAGKTLPIADVPNLQPGDRIWIHPDLPDNQSVHYLLIAAFLRGPTNPPPEKWFTKTETWSKQVRDEGIVITVPKDAQQALLFLAPETGGDFNSLRSAVQGKPGAFVRASQDLNQASLDRTRLEKYLDSVRQTTASDPKLLHDHSVMLARSLSIKLDQTCFEKPSEQQISCLTQNSDQLVLDDQHSQSLVATLTSGVASDLIGQVSSTPMARSGYYGSYVGAVVDVARLLSTYHSPDFQYIPALALPHQDDLNLKLNNPPSFRKPKSVIVIGLPAVAEALVPPLHAVDPTLISCLQKVPVILAAEGAPLAFSTGYAHDLVLHLEGKSHAADLPAIADATLGGFLVDTHPLQAAKLDAELVGTLRGFWGFQAFTGPSFRFCNAHSENWSLAAGSEKALIVGRNDTLRLQAQDTTCVENVTVKDPAGKIMATSWKATKPTELEVEVPLQNIGPGNLTLLVQNAGLPKPDELSLPTYTEAAQLDRFVLNAGDPEGILRGNRLDEVASVELQNVRFVPANLSRADEKDVLQMNAANPDAMGTLHPDDRVMAHVMLKDGRMLELQTAVAPPRPKVKLIGKNFRTPPDAAASTIRLSSADDLPQNAVLSFFVKTEVPAAFPRPQKIEVAAVDDSFHALLSMADRNLTLQDSETVLATLDPLKDFGPSAFGPLHFRPVSPNGVPGDWEPLANLVRVPSLKEIRCPENPEKPCTLIGTDLFLIDSVSANSRFTHPVTVPVGFSDTSLSVPRPYGTLLYIKLRDDTSAINTTSLPVLPDPQ